MKYFSKFLVITGLLSSALQANAGVPIEVKKLMDKEGIFISLVDGKKTNDDGTICEVKMNPYGGESSIVIDSVAYFTPVAHFDQFKKSSKNGIIYFELPDTGRRPGGSVCGDMTPLLNYKKWVEVGGDSLLIKEQYRCLFEGKTLVVQGCKLN